MILNRVTKSRLAEDRANWKLSVLLEVSPSANSLANFSRGRWKFGIKSSPELTTAVEVVELGECETIERERERWRER